MSISKEDVRCERLPSEVDVNFNWSIRRAPPDKALAMVCLSSDIFGIRTHFYRGRTGPCLKEDCEACSRKLSSRWTGYVLAKDVKDRSSIVFEFTPGVATTLDKHFQIFKTLRGLQMIASRTSNKANGKVILTLKGMVDQDVRLSAEEDVWPILSHIWGLNEVAVPKLSANDPYSLSEKERVINGLILPPGDDDQWMERRAITSDEHERSLPLRGLVPVGDLVPTLLNSCGPVNGAAKHKD